MSNGCARNMAGRALWFPIRNFRAESADATMPFLKMIVDRLEAGEGVVMHCAHGQGRAGTMAVCVLMMFGASTDDALRTRRRPSIRRRPGRQGSQWALVEDVASATQSGRGPGRPAVDLDDRPGGVARRRTRQVQGGADDLGRLTATLERDRGLGPSVEGVEVPGLADVGQERPGHDPVDPHGRPEHVGERHGQGVETGLGRAVRHLGGVAAGSTTCC